MLTTLIAVIHGYAEQAPKTICLTFDDGPGPYTEQLLDLLQQYHVKATFFVVDTPYVELLTRMALEGHTIGCHSACHEYGEIYRSSEAYWEDFDKIQQVVEVYTGEKPLLLRFPGGSSNTISKKYCPGLMSQLARETESRELRYFDWNVDSGDGSGLGDTETVYQNVISGIRGQAYSVVLQHDIHRFSVDAVERIIQWGLQNGYRFAPLTADSPDCHHIIVN